MKNAIAIVIVLCAGLLLAQVALAEQGRDKGQRGGGPGKGQRRPPVVFGTLQSISGSTWTIKPQLPPEMRERREAKGKEMPQLPDKLEVTISESTKYYFDGDAASAGSFKVGDEIVIKLAKPGGDGNPQAQIVADPETAREFIMDKLREGRGGGQGEGKDGRGGEGRRGPRPMFGTVTAVSADSLTIKPEIPDFVVERMPGKGDKLEGKLPDSITVALDGETRFIVGEREQASNPFKVGDKVAILGAGPKGDVTARAVSDYASAQRRMQQRIEKRQQKQGKG